MKKLSVVAILLLAIIVMVKTVQIGQNLRTVHIYSDEQGLHHVYFTEPRAGEGMKFLGEEIFKDGKKVLDTFKENDIYDR